MEARPVYSTLSLLFHVGLLLVPLFLAAHVLLWKRSIGLAWPMLPQVVSNDFTLLVVVTGLGLFIGRVANADSRKLSRWQDIAWPPLLMVPFITGYICSNLPSARRATRRRCCFTSMRRT